MDAVSLLNPAKYPLSAGLFLAGVSLLVKQEGLADETKVYFSFLLVAVLMYIFGYQGEVFNRPKQGVMPGKGSTWRENKGVSVIQPLTYVWKSKKGKRSKSPATGDNSSAHLPAYTMDEISKHTFEEDCWVIVEGHVYDVTPFVNDHPGGWLPMFNVSGKDATDAFMNYHSANVSKNMLPRYLIGRVKDPLTPSQFVQEARQIRQDMLAEACTRLVAATTWRSSRGSWSCSRVPST